MVGGNRTLGEKGGNGLLGGGGHNEWFLKRVGGKLQQLRSRGGKLASAGRRWNQDTDFGEKCRGMAGLQCD